MLKTTGITSLNTNNHVSFKSNFKDNETLQKYIKVANNNDLMDFCNLLEKLRDDGKDCDYFITETMCEVWRHYGSYNEKQKYPEINLFKYDNIKGQTKKIESFILGAYHLEVANKDVISELTSILKRRSFLSSPEVRKSVIENLAKVLIK